MIFESAFITLLKKHEKMIITSGVVSEVFENCIHVKREGMSDLLEVRFHSILTPVEDYLKVTPKLGSAVLCGIIENSAESILIATSEIDKINLNIGTTAMTIDVGGFEILRDQVNLKEVLKQGLENQNEVNKVLQKVVVSVGATPDVSKLKTIENSTKEVVANLLKILK